MSNQITIKEKDEEQFSVYVGDAYLGTYSHDSIGWEGMSSVRKLIYGLSKHLNIEVEEIIDESDD